MSELQQLVDQLIEIIHESLEPNLQVTTEARESFASPRLVRDVPSVEDIKKILSTSDHEKNPEHPLFQLFLETFELIHPLTCNYIFLNETQQTRIKTALVELLTILNTLLSTHEDSILITDSGIELRGFIIDEDFDEKHAVIGQNINKKFSNFLELAKRSPDELSKKISDIIHAYQKEVEPDFLRVENLRLQEEIKQLKALLSEQKTTIQNLTTQYITGIPIPTSGEIKQQKRAPSSIEAYTKVISSVGTPLRGLGLFPTSLPKPSAKNESTGQDQHPDSFYTVCPFAY